MTELTQQDVEAKIAALGDITVEQRNNIVCALIGHSHIITGFMGYQYCGRCSAQIGDTLASVGVGDVVLIGHNCATCQANYAGMDWKHKLFVPDPFAVTEDAERDKSTEGKV